MITLIFDGTYFDCPVCGDILDYAQQYCCDCGQALDWSEEE